MSSVSSVLLGRPYPGRGCVVGRVGDGSLWFAYFLTGRSPASRSRALEVRPDGEVAVVDTSGAGGGDPLRHYVALARRKGWTVLGNGDQVEPLATALAEGAAVTTAWAARTYEPDPPIFTPRIWAVHEGETGQVMLGSARRSGRPDGSADRLVLLPETLPAGSGVLVTTYAGTVEQVVPSGLPIDVSLAARTGEEFLTEIWESLPSTLRVAALVAQPDGPVLVTP